MPLARRFRLPALFCALAVLVCELLSRPYATMGVVDDGPYTLMARHLAAAGHIVFNGWAAPMLGWQLYLGAAFIKLFGSSFTSVRMSTLLIAMVMAWLLQRTMARAGISERNATLGTLALVLSPLYLMLSVTYMTDIFGLFAVVICLYGCLRALQAATEQATIAWLWFAVATNAVFGTARQIAWLGILVMLPSTLYLLGRRGPLHRSRRVLLSGASATLAGALFILACMQWLARQPYTLPEPLLVPHLPVVHTLAALAYLFADLPFLSLPLTAVLMLELRGLGALSKAQPGVVGLLVACSAAYLLLGLHWRHLHPNLLLEPTMRDWVNVHGIFEGSDLQGDPPIFLNRAAQIGITAVCFAGGMGLVVCLLRPRAGAEAAREEIPGALGSLGSSGSEDSLNAGNSSRSSASLPALRSPQAARALTLGQLGVLLLPFVLAYTLLLVPRAALVVIYDRYALDLLPFAVVLLLRCYQQYARPQLPLLTGALVGVVAVCGVAMTHNNFAYYRARAALAAELRAAGIPDTQVDNGWEYNSSVEIERAGYVNDPHIVTPAHAYTPVSPPAAGSCPMHGYEGFREIHPLYGVSFDANECYGEAPFAPVHYSRWPYRSPGTLYVVRYLPTGR
ncbi:MAG: ArnT family glycosyltransferase [Acidobacteriaceae bacterium]